MITHWAQTQTSKGSVVTSYGLWPWSQVTVDGVAVTTPLERIYAEELAGIPELDAQYSDPPEADEEEAAADEADDQDEAEPDLTELPVTTIGPAPLTGILPIKETL